MTDIVAAQYFQGKQLKRIALYGFLAVTIFFSYGFICLWYLRFFQSLPSLGCWDLSYVNKMPFKFQIKTSIEVCSSFL